LHHPLDPVFDPRAVALVGISSSARGRGAEFLHALLDQRFQERRPLYLVNPRASEIQGLRCYPTLADTPGPVDHVISLIPRDGARGLVEQCIAKGVRSLHFFTAGFSESGEDGMAEAERELAALARAGGVRVLGPNCMGLYVPAARLAFSVGLPREPGDVMGISQSGAHAGDIVQGIGDRGARFSKVVSFGNGSDIAAAELFDYAAADAQTALVVAYLEGTGDGRGLFAALRRCAAVKPTLVLKGGFTAAGARAASSHTGSLAGSAEVFDALCRQAGALRVETMEELHDAAIAVSTSARRVRGGRTVLVGGGGGFSVLSADALARRGLDLPELAAATREQLRPWVPVAGNSIRNPIDAGFMGANRREAIAAVTAIAAAAPGYDLTLVATGAGGRRAAAAGRPGDPDEDEEREADPAERAREQVARLAALQERQGRPIVVVRRDHEGPDGGPHPLDALAYAAGIATFASVARAARAIELLLGWRRSRAGLPELF
jgi:acyl-CoA synthetase (NDP forming)